MTFEIRVTAQAGADIDEAFAWLWVHARGFAPRWLEGLHETLASLAANPSRCPIAPESSVVGRELRHLLYQHGKTEYRVFFEVRERTVIIVRVRHTSRHPPSAEDLALPGLR